MGKCILAGHTTCDTGGLRIATGSYVGTGATSVTLTFPFTPKVLIVANHNKAGCYAISTSGYNTNGGQGFVVIYGTTKYIVGQYHITESFPTIVEVTFSWDGESVSWRGFNDEWIANESKQNYDWLIIG